MGYSRVSKLALRFSAGMTAVLLLAGFCAVTTPSELPDFTKVKKRFETSDLILLDARGVPLHQWRQNPKERVFSWVSLDQVSPALKSAVLKSEDRNFYRHRGTDWRALGASIIQRTLFGSSRGGSTISMQVAKLTSAKRSEFHGIIGKWRQVRASAQLERQWSKDEILEAYLNLVSFRGEYRGIGSTSWAFFNKAPAGLTLKESTLLAVLIRSPNASTDLWTKRACWQEEVLCTEFKTWLAEFSRNPTPHLELNDALHLAQRLSRQGLVGEVRTSLRADVQKYARELLRSRVSELSSQNVRDAALLVIENRTGEVWAYVGGAGLSSQSTYVDGIQAKRQAGSTLKPFLYATAFEKNILRPESWLEDSAVDIVFERGVYKPQNHDKKFYGWVQAKTALGSSLNVPAVKVFKLLNDESFWEKLHSLHFRDLQDPEHYGPALALGVTDVTLEDLTQAYRTLAQDGEYTPLTFHKAVEGQEEQVFNADVAQAVAQILADNQNRSLSFGLDSALSVPGAAVKTGTSKDMRDNWCVGFNSRFTVGVWVGNFSGEPMWNVLGITGAAPIWQKMMERLEETYPSQPRPFLQGQTPTSAPARYPRAQILYPQNGLVVALDPAIPQKNQKLPLISEAPVGSKLIWKINGKKEVSADKTYLWTPTPGKNKFELYRDGRFSQSVEILVK